MKHIYATILALFAVSLVVAQCDYTLELRDNFDNGWGGGSQMTVTINGTATVYTVPDPPGDINVVTLTVNDGDTLLLDYIADSSFPGDNEFTLFDSEGIQIIDSGLNPATGNYFNGTASCPTCPAVSNITTNAIVATSANVLWTAGGSETSWIIEYGVAPYTCGSGGTQVPANSNPFNLTGLTAETTYDIYVIAVCGPADESACQGPVQITTTEACPAPSNFAPITNTANSVSFVWATGGNLAAGLEVEYGLSGFVPDSGVGTIFPAFTAPFVDVTGLASDTEYDFYVRIDCGVDGFSEWAGPFTSRTLISCPVVTALQTTGISFDSIDISWTAGQAETAWEVEYAPVGTITTPFASPTPQGTVLSASMPSASIPGLTDATAYDIYVRGICDPALPDFSSGVLLNATTLCLPFAPTTAAPYLEDFEGFAASTNFVEELCWSASSVDAFDWNIDGAGSTPSGGTGPNAAFSGVNYFYTEASSGTAGTSIAILNGPQFDLSGLTNPSIQFYYHMFGGQIGDLIVEVDDLTGSGWTALTTVSGQQQAMQSDPWLLQISSLAAYAGQTIQIRFRAVSAGTFEGDISLDDILIGELPPCADPNRLTVDSLFDTTAVLGWSENGVATSWEVEVQPAGVSQGTAGAIFEDLAATNPVSVSGLIAETSYDFYVRSNCGVDGFSAWVGPFNFTTKCAPILAPVTEDFETFTALVDFNEENCWEGSWNSTSFTEWNWNVDGVAGTPTPNTGPDGASSGTNYFYIEGNGGAIGNEAVLLTPIMDISGLTAPAMQFSSHMFGADIGILHVDVNDGTGFTDDVLVLTGQQQTSGNSPWDVQVVDLLTFNGTGSVQVRFRAERTHTGFTGLSDIAIDDVVFDEIPACPQPSALNVGTITDVTSELLWNENGSATAWSIEYGPCGFTPGDATATTVPAGTNPFTISGLTAFTCYEYYIVADCGAGTLSAASGPGTFTTACATFAAPYLDTFEAFTASTTFVEENCWEANSDSVYDWNLDNSGSTPSAGTGPTGAFSGTNYFYIEASGGALGDEARLISPFIDITALTTPSIQFKYHMFGAETGTLHIDVNDGTGWIDSVDTIVGQQQTATTDDWRDALIDLASVTLTGNVIQVRLRAENAGTFAGDISIDDFRVDDIPTCPSITMLTTGVVNSTSVDLNWVAGATEVEWIVEYRAVGTTAFTTVTPNATATTASVTGLTSDTVYEFCVSAVCAPGDISQQVCTNVATSPDYCAGDAFTDSGNVTGDYQNNESITYNICPDNAGDVVYVNFVAFETETRGATLCWDGLTIHDGPDDTFPTIDTPALGSEWCFENGAGTGDLTLELLIGTSTSGCITLVWRSDGSGQRAGWEANVTCAPPPTCDAPSLLTATNFGTTTADLAWTAGGTETDWEVEVGLVGFTPGTATSAIPVVAVNPLPATTVTGLTGDTQYEYYVRAVCAPGDESIFRGPFAFKTECAAIVAPYIEDFETFTAELDFVEENCWKGSFDSTTFNDWDWNLDDNGGTPTINTGPAGAFNGNSYFYIEGNGGAQGSEASLFSPLVDVSALTAPSLQFNYHMFGTVTGDLHVDINDGSGFVNDVIVISGQQQTSESAPWDLAVIDLSAYTGSTIQARFRAVRTDGAFTGLSDIAIDNVIFDEALACAQPSILASGNITDVTAELSWNENGSATSWNVEYGICGFTPGSGTTVPATSNTAFQISGLTPETCYDFYITSDCGMGTFSNTAGPSSFNTECAAIVAPYVEGFESFAITTNFAVDNCWSTPQLTGYSWDVGTGATVSNNTGPTGAASGSNYFFVEASTGINGAVTELVSPFIDLSALTTPALTFSYHMFGADINTLDVDVNDGTGWTNSLSTLTGAQQNADTDPWQSTVISLGAYNGATIQFRFRATRGASFAGDISIDDVSVDDFNGCLPPSGLAVSNVTSVSADFAWTIGGTETAWEYVNQAAGTGLPTGAGTSVGMTSVSLGTLASSTAFEFYVRADCGSGNFSDWIGPISYATDCAPIPVPYGSMTGAPGNDFATFAGVCWELGDNTPIASGPNGLAGSWFAGDFANDTAHANGRSASINIFGTNPTNDWLVTPEFDLGAGGTYSAIFDIAHTDFDATNATNFGSDDEIQFLVTDDGGVTWTSLQTWDDSTTVSNTGENVIVDISSYTGIVRFAFWGTNGTTAGTDTDFFVDNFTVDGTPASNNTVEELGFNFYPNPVNDVLTITGAQNIVKASVMNMLGQEVMTVQPGVTNAKIDMTTLSAGIYLVQVTTDNRTSTIRVVKE